MSGYDLKKYAACLSCMQNIPYNGTCKAGYKNYYCTEIKDNKCPKCQAEVKATRCEDAKNI